MKADKVVSTRVYTGREQPRTDGVRQTVESTPDHQIQDIGLSAMPVLPSEPPPAEAQPTIVRAADPEPEPELKLPAFQGIGPAHSPTAMADLEGAVYGTHGLTSTDLATRQKAVADDLGMAAHIFASMAYGTPGNTFTDVATRQKAVQDGLNQAALQLAKGGVYGTPGNTFTDVAARQKVVADDLNMAAQIFASTVGGTPHTFTDVATRQKAVQDGLNQAALQLAKGGVYGTPGNTFTDVAARQKATQQALNAAQVLTHPAWELYGIQTDPSEVSSLLDASRAEGYLSLTTPPDVATRHLVHEQVLHTAHLLQGEPVEGMSFTAVATRQKAIQDLINAGNLQGALAAQRDLQAQ